MFRNHRLGSTLAAAGLLLGAAVHGQAPLQKVLLDNEVAPNWIYDDFARAQEQARATKKPILALLRCVP